MSTGQIRHLIAIEDCIFLCRNQVQEAREDTLLLLECVKAAPTDVALEIGVGMGVGAVIIGKKVKNFYGVDINSEAVKATVVNGLLNDIDLSTKIRVGDCFKPFNRKKFDLIFSNPPQLPTPGDKERPDWIGWSNNGGHDGRRVLDKIIRGANKHLNAGGRLYLLHFEICNIELTIDLLENMGFKTKIVGTRRFPLGAVSFERLQYITSSVSDKIVVHNSRYVHNVSVILATKRR